MAKLTKAAAKAAAQAALDTAIADFEDAVRPIAVIEHRIASVVTEWRREHLTNNAFSQDTGAWNVLHGKLPHLIRAIVEEIG